MQCVGRKPLSDIAPHGIPAHNPCLRELIPEYFSGMILTHRIMKSRTARSQAVKAASPARYLAELHAIPTACWVIEESFELLSYRRAA